MHIIGNVPDIYDQMPYAYGVDYKIVMDKRLYNNLPQKIINTIDDTSYSVAHKFATEFGFNRKYYINNELYEQWEWRIRRNNPNPKIKYDLWNLYYCGMVYLIAHKLERYDDNQYVATNEYYTVSNTEDGDAYCMIPNANIDLYAKENNIPFFVYTTSYKDSMLTILPHVNYIPLHTIKIPMFDDVSVVYNDIYNHLSSYLNDDDCIEVSNTDKIKQAGFDLKTSFRKM